MVERKNNDTKITPEKSIKKIGMEDSEARFYDSIDKLIDLVLKWVSYFLISKNEGEFLSPKDKLIALVSNWVSNFLIDINQLKQALPEQVELIMSIDKRGWLASLSMAIFFILIKIGGGLLFFINWPSALLLFIFGFPTN